MLKLITKDEYLNILNKIEEFKPVLSQRKGHKDYLFLKMESEDGMNNLQGIVSLEVYETRKGNVGNIQTLWVNPDFRGNKYGEILVHYIMKYTLEKFDNMYSFMVASNREALKCFKNNGFESDNETRSTIRLFKEVGK